jgi:translation initiation factor 2B subunit (eIF-2B alpha/beta/delta family)
MTSHHVVTMPRVKERGEIGWAGVEAAAADSVSGAAEIARRAAEALAVLPANDLERGVLTLVEGHPSMASLWRLGSEVLGASDHATAARAFIGRLDAEAEAVAASATGLLDGPVLLHSYSSTAVVAVARAGVPALCARSEPEGEGAKMAEALRSRGVPAHVIDDSEALGAAGKRIVLVGSDAVGPEGVVNKIGTRALAEAARAAGSRCYALIGTSKLLASDLPASHPFERTPLELFTAIVTETGPQMPDEIAATLPGFELHPALAARLAAGF